MCIFYVFAHVPKMNSHRHRPIMARLNRINKKPMDCRPGKHKGKHVKRNKYTLPTPDFLSTQQQKPEQLTNASFPDERKQDDWEDPFERKRDFEHNWKEELKFSIRVTRLGATAFFCLLASSYFSAAICTIKISFTVFNYIAPPPDRSKIALVDNIELGIEMVKAAVKIIGIAWK